MVADSVSVFNGSGVANKKKWRTELKSLLVPKAVGKTLPRTCQSLTPVALVASVIGVSRNDTPFRNSIVQPVPIHV